MPFLGGTPLRTLSPVKLLAGDRLTEKIFASLCMRVERRGEQQSGETSGTLSLTSRGLCDSTELQPF